MSIADLYDISRAVRREKAREQDLLPVPTSLAASSPRICNICYQQPSKYNCPKCNIPYCSLLCFRAEAHQSCATDFSTVSLRNHVSLEKDTVVEEREREKLFDILQRVETQDIQQRQQAEEDESSEEGETVANDELDSAANIDSEALETASVQDLLHMLTPKQRQAFDRAMQSPVEAQKLMNRLERKADRLNLGSSDVSSSSMSSPSDLLHAVASDKFAQSGRDLVAHALAKENVENTFDQPQRRIWQSQPWFEGQEGYPSAFVKHPEILDAFVGELGKLLAASAPSTGAVDLTFNLAAVLMSYTYLIRHFDVECLSDLDISAPSSSVGSEAFDILGRLVPFLTYSTPKSSQPGLRDPGKLVLLDLDDAVFSLLSHLSYEDELASGADQLRRQLLTDLNLLTQQAKILSIPEAGKSEPHEAVSSRLIIDQYTFTARQHSRIVNAVADLFSFLELISKSAAVGAPHISSRTVKSAQRKLYFYLVNNVFRTDTAASAYHRLPDLIKVALSKVEEEIGHAHKADRIEIANKLAGNGEPDATYKSRK